MATLLPSDDVGGGGGGNLVTLSQSHFAAKLFHYKVENKNVIISGSQSEPR